MQRFDLLDEYTTICVPIRAQKGLPKSSPDKQLMRAGHLLVAGFGWLFRAIAGAVARASCSRTVNPDHLGRERLW